MECKCSLEADVENCVLGPTFTNILTMTIAVAGYHSVWIFIKWTDAVIGCLSSCFVVIFFCPWISFKLIVSVADCGAKYRCYCHLILCPKGFQRFLIESPSYSRITSSTVSCPVGGPIGTGVRLTRLFWSGSIRKAVLKALTCSVATVGYFLLILYFIYYLHGNPTSPGIISLSE